MSTLLYAQNRKSVPANEKEVRSTTDVVENDDPSATQPNAPDFNEYHTDPDTEGGLTTRQLASHVVASEQSVPFWAASASSADEHNAIINRQVSSSGTAAAREAAGQWGHGTLMVTDGIEPAIADGHAFGTDYFEASKHHVQPTMVAMMTPSVAADNGTLSAVQATANDNAARAANPYSQWLTGATQ